MASLCMTVSFLSTTVSIGGQMKWGTQATNPELYPALIKLETLPLMVPPQKILGFLGFEKCSAMTIQLRHSTDCGVSRAVESGCHKMLCPR